MADSARQAGRRPVVVIVDDDDLFRESLEQNLIESDFEVVDFGDAPAALDHLSAGDADLVLLDWKMSPMSGIELLRRLREGGAAVPVIFLTALSDQIYEEAALIGGAVDFVEKSRSFTILLKRIELILSGPKIAARSPARARRSALVRRGELALDADANRAHWKGRRVALSRSEFTIVSHLARRDGGDVGYRELDDLVRGSGFAAGAGPDGYRANVRTFLRRIRRKFRDIDDDFDEIENFPGFGYRWRGLGE